MECVYISDLNQDFINFQVKKENASHLRALRLTLRQKIIFTNGSGLSAVCNLHDIKKGSYNFIIEKYFHDYGEFPVKFGLAIGLLSDRNRFEFALEKAVELGVTDFYPLLTARTEKRTINKERLQSKAISALQQCKRSKLIRIHKPIELKNIFANHLVMADKELNEESKPILSEYKSVILADENGDSPESTKHLESVICVVGPEGGLTDDEVELIASSGKTLFWNLGDRRLRAETAAISVLSITSLKIKQNNL